MLTSALAPALENYQRQINQMIEQLLLAAQRGQETDLVSPRLDLATEPPASSWPPLPAMAFHAAVTAFVAFVLLAFWEEKKESAPAEALLVIIGTLFAWAQFNQQVWNRYLK
jgi:hypothetical protein